MKLADLDPAFVRRLENWGSYYRGGLGRTVESPTYRVCEQLAVAHGQPIKDDWREVSPRPEIDEDDAMIVERHWRMCAHRVGPKDRALIRAHWVDEADPRFVCRVLCIRYLSWEKLICEAVVSFQHAVALLESCNPLKNIR